MTVEYRDLKLPGRHLNRRAFLGGAAVLTGATVAVAAGLNLPNPNSPVPPNKSLTSLGTRLIDNVAIPSLPDEVYRVNFTGAKGVKPPIVDQIRFQGLSNNYNVLRRPLQEPEFTIPGEIIEARMDSVSEAELKKMIERGLYGNPAFSEGSNLTGIDTAGQELFKTRVVVGKMEEGYALSTLSGTQATVVAYTSAEPQETSQASK
ncbi:hypothetical protein A2714_00575 [Candidatus Woesebacteria bacterium RIFCSPHIGHO2_01_FULL_38_9]|uniref:Twin-arginine translocation signal domain-containing protein n=2 Tax=Candidatus Woeseibacteriota TaxID=1752722 RepID=A0A1F7Y224_9BACT|nr:MAG: hypothetical protein A2714_00575 [Candidatus Woesebacteria bacterium RIFCSPHIGHO2_01_FULL_38_9]OGM61067.1 MAG: hypothetical protein A3A75_02815 [Candidatus Woesebacteria bacterium RIFCSPLOWO2_01_FULL_39_10]